MDVKVLKYISIPIIFFVNFIIGICPYFLISKKIKKITGRLSAHLSHSDIGESFVMSSGMKRFLSLANFFCGGVFLATCLIGLYPGVHKKFKDIIRKRPSIPDYPYAGLSLAVGFFLVWILEILVHSCIHCYGHSHDHTHRNSSDNNDMRNNLKLVNTSSFNNNSPTSPLYPDDPQHQPQPSDRLLDPDPCPEEEKISFSDCPPPVHDEDIHEAHSHVPIKGNLLGSLMLTFALGSHSIIEGLGFAMISDFSITLNMLITVLIHESVCALSLGVNLASKRTHIWTSLSLLATFSALIPVGISIGMVVTIGIEKNLLGDAVTAILQGIAAGTFIYVVFMEILPSELKEHKDMGIKALLMIIGFAVIASMKIFHPHGHRSVSNCTNGTMVSSAKTHTH